MVSVYAILLIYTIILALSRFLYLDRVKISMDSMYLKYLMRNLLYKQLLNAFSFAFFSILHLTSEFHI